MDSFLRDFSLHLLHVKTGTSQSDRWILWGLIHVSLWRVIKFNKGLSISFGISCHFISHIKSTDARRDGQKLQGQKVQFSQDKEVVKIKHLLGLKSLPHLKNCCEPPLKASPQSKAQILPKWKMKSQISSFSFLQRTYIPCSHICRSKPHRTSEDVGRRERKHVKGIIVLFSLKWEYVFMLNTGIYTMRAINLNSYSKL